MTRIGADPGQLIEAAAGFDQLAESLDAAQHEISGLVNGDWWGPDADRFRGAWASVFRAELVRQAAAIRTYADATRRQAEQQQGASDDRPAGTAGTAGSGSPAGSAGGSTTGTRTYRLQDVGGEFAAKGSWSDKGSVQWSNEQPGSPTPVIKPDAQPAGPGQPGFEPDVYRAWFLKQAGLEAADQTINGGNSVSASQSADWTQSTRGQVGDSGLGASAGAGVDLGLSADASSSYAYKGPHAGVTAEANLRAAARVFGDFEVHAWNIAGASGQAVASVEAGASGHAEAFADLSRGFGFDAQGSAYAGAHAAADLSINAIGAGAHLGAELNAGWGVYGSATAAWTNEKGLTLGLSGGFGLKIGFGVDAEVSFHPGKTWDAAVAGVTNAGSAVINTAVTAVDTAGKIANAVGAAVNDTVAAMDPRNWNWPW